MSLSSRSLVLLILALAISLPAHAQTTDTASSDVASTSDSEASNSYPEEIDSFRSDITVHADGTASVVETILYNFHDQEKHGIYRTIPSKGAPGTLGDLRLTHFSVTDEQGTPYEFTDPGVSAPGVFSTLLQVIAGSSIFSSVPSEYDVKIGNADATITGTHTYRISYTALNALGDFAERDEIYWNATGNAWQVPVLAAETHMFLPKTIPADQLHLASYCGPEGATDSCADPVVIPHPDQGTTEVVFKPASLPLSEEEGMTVAVGFPKGIVTFAAAPKPSLLLEILGYWFVPVPLLLVWFLRRKRIAYFLVRRAFYKKNVVIAEYDPGELTPLEASALAMGGPKDKDLSAEIIWLAVKGYLTIQKTDGQYSFTATGKEATALSAYDQELLTGIVGKHQSDLVDTFYMTANTIKTQVLDSLRLRGYLEDQKTPSHIYVNGSKVQSLVIGSILVSFFLAINPGVFVFAILGYKFGIIFSATCVLYGLSAIIIGAGTRLSEKGLQAEWLLKGLLEYIHVAEEARIKFANAPAKTPETFEKLLPYAMVFGLEKEWAKQFEGIYTAPPTWYTGDTSLNTFSAIAFASNLEHFSSTTTSTLASSPVSAGSSDSFSGSSGGGSSGGGGGGGGGGSW